MESALLVDVDVACSGLGPRVSVMVRDSGSFCFLSGSKRAFISLSTGLSYQCTVKECEKIHFNSEVPRLSQRVMERLCIPDRHWIVFHNVRLVCFRHELSKLAGLSYSVLEITSLLLLAVCGFKISSYAIARLMAKRRICSKYRSGALARLIVKD